MAEEIREGASGAVLVIGGGIAGIQSSLDLAESGYKVYLVEKSPAIGGTMAQLDKTFPTNDCAMCIVSPKLVSCGRHRNIELLTDSEVAGISGAPGDFRVRVRRKPRFVDMETCTGCGECAEACPVSVRSEFDEGLVTRRAAYKPYAQAAPNAFVLEKRGIPPCQAACPSDIHVQGYVALVRDGRIAEAWELIRERNPFPSVCGRVCHHPCESECTRGDYDDPLAIASIKRFIADTVRKRMASEPPSPAPPPTGERVAVIGGGPAGLTCAFYLARRGYRPTVFEKDPKPGGMMRWAIPAYRLPKADLDWEIDRLLEAGVDLRCDSPIDSWERILELRREGFRAVYLAVGTPEGIPLRIEGEDLRGVQSGIGFLRGVALGGSASPGARVAVVGGGNTAIDCARTALRLGSEVTVHYRRTRHEMPAQEAEIVAAEEEGVRFEFLSAPVRCLGAGGALVSVVFERMRLGEPDAGGRRRPEPTGETFDAPCDGLISAVSQTADLGLLEGSGVALSRWNTVEADPGTFRTNIDWLFAGGDVVLGPASVVEAVGQAWKAAESIDRMLRGEAPETAPHGQGEIVLPGEVPAPSEVLPRTPMPELPAEVRSGGFEECETGFSPEEARREASRCLDCGICSGCNRCAEVCEAGAVLHDMVGETREFRVGAVIVATGASKFDPSGLHEYGYGRFPNVLTSIQFERVLAASGPFEGHLQRPSDGTVPTRIAWLQCVGSRTDDTGMPYCSSVCCMYAIKEAIIAKEHVGTVQPTIFFMDMRAYGKDFERYYDRAKAAGVRFVRGRVGRIREVPGSGNLLVSYAGEEGGAVTEEFDLVVLSAGFRPHADNGRLTDTLGIRLDAHGFVEARSGEPVLTTKPGIFVCGPATAPKDIPETVMQASGSVAAAAEILGAARGSEITRKEYPEEKDVAGLRPRIGVFVCHCGINIGSVVDIPEVVRYARTLPDVVYAEENLFTCSQDTQERMKELIAEHRLNRVVVSSCSPSTHEPLFQETIREAGLNPHLFAMANIRNQCSWVHRDDHPGATRKARILTRIAVGRARLLKPLHTVVLDVVQKALVVGGGLAGMTAALSIAEQGFDAVLVEREDRLGGNLLRLRTRPDGGSVGVFLDDLVRRVESHPRIAVHAASTIESIEGYIGNYLTTVVAAATGERTDFEHGVIVLATGGEETRPAEYLYGEAGERVLTQLELEKVLDETPGALAKAGGIVMIQCVGSRDEEHPYCSRVCCTQAVKNAIRIRETNPGCAVTILYRDIRTYGFNELYYREARSLGVLFVRYDTDSKPVVEATGADGSGKLRVVVRDPILGGEIEIGADRVVLASAMEPRGDSAILSRMLKVPLNEDGFFLEAHAKLRPVDFSAEGIFLAGLAHSPKGMDETASQARAAAERACTIIGSDTYLSVANVASVDPDVCTGCGMCVSVCPFGAPGLVWSGGRRVCEVNAALCKGCGSCATVCPSGAMQQLGFSEEQTLEMLRLAL